MNNESNKDNRILWLDAAKAIGILWVMLGHCRITGKMFCYIFSFHMPLFFFLSGVLFERIQNKTFSELLLFVAKKRIYPYLCLSFVSLLCVCWFDYLNNIECSVGLWSIKAIVLSKRNEIIINDPLWFLTSIAITELYVYGLKKVLKSDGILMLTSIVIGLVIQSIFGTMGSERVLPWSIDCSLFYGIFYTAGYIFNKNNKENFVVRIAPYVVLFGGIVNITYLLNPRLLGDIMSFGVSYVVAFGIVLPFSGIAFWCGIAKLLENSRILTFIGRNTVIILGLHTVLVYNLIDLVFEICNIRITVLYNIQAYVYLIIALIMFVPIIKVVNSYFGRIININWKKQ